MHDAITTIRLMDIVPGTSTNADAVALFVAMDQLLDSGNKIRLSLESATPLSTSFLNSSIGNLVDKFGLEKFRSQVVFSHLTPSQIRSIKAYFDQISC